MRLFLLALFILSVASEETVNDETKQRCLYKDFRSYTHCIRKRDTGVVSWCSAPGCTSCVGNSCQVTCKGVSCGSCPAGDCCDSKTCNACYNTMCCSTPACNYCINTCRHACGNATMSSSCQNGCIQQCHSDTHEVFIVPAKPQVPGDPNVVVYIKGVPHEGHITSGHLPTSNKTAVVSVDGVSYPATILILVPIVPTSPCQQGQNPQIVNQSYYNKLQNGCCHIVHPPQCYNNQVYPYQHCTRRSHQECSSLCNSKFIHLAPHHQNQCHYLRTYPYVYCGQHAAQKCDNCYVCDGKYNPNACVQRSECSNSCRQGFSPPDPSKFQIPVTDNKPCQGIQRPTGNLQPVLPHQLMELPQNQMAQYGGAPLQYG